MKLTSIAQEQRFQIEVCLRLWAWNLCGLGIAWWQWLCIYRYDGNEGVLSEIPCLQKNTQMEIKALTPNHSGRTGDVTPKRSFLWNDSCFNAFCADEILIVAEFSWPCWELMFNLRLPIHHPARSQQKKSAGRWRVQTFLCRNAPANSGKMNAMSGPSLVLKCVKWVA